MSLVVDDQRFETLRGTMLTDEGLDGILQFAKKLPDFVVIDDAFTDRAAEILPASIRGEDNTLSDGVPEVHNLHCFFQDVCWSGLDKQRGLAGFYDPKEGGMDWHVDINSSHTALGFFNVSGSPRFEVQTGRTEEKHIWRDPYQIRYLLEIGYDEPVEIPLKNKQLILLNGKAAEATTPSKPGQTFRASLPHRAVVGDSDQRDRLMYYATPLV